MTRLNKKTAHLIASGLVALSLSASAIAADKLLYDRLGGKDALNAVVGELWSVVAADARINARFKTTKPEVFGAQLVVFLCRPVAARASTRART